MELRDYFSVLRRRWVTVAVIFVSILAAAGAWTALAPREYTATTSLFFGVQGGQSLSDLAQGSTFTEKQLSSYAHVATSPLVLKRVTNELGLSVPTKALAKATTATAEVDSVILDLTVTERDPQLAARIANSIAKQLTFVATNLVPKSPTGSKSVQITVLAAAVPPDVASSPKVTLNLALGIGLGLLVGIGAALLRDVLDTKIRGAADIRDMTNSPVVGTIPNDPKEPQHHIATQADPSSLRSEAIRSLRTNIQFLNVTRPSPALLVTSSILREGKSTTAINLAVSLAEAGSRVLLIDADLRRPSVARYLGLNQNLGLTSVLLGQFELEEVVQHWNASGLSVLPAGQVPPNPSELLGSGAMLSLLKAASTSYDIVLLDSPPVLAVTDAIVLSKLTDSTLLVASIDRVHKQQFSDALAALATVDATIIGIVLNMVSRKQTNTQTQPYSRSSLPSWEAPPTPRFEFDNRTSDKSAQRIN